MKTIVGLDNLSTAAGPSAVTIGTFDGVHAGHRALIARTIEHARALDAAATAVTWDRHPNETLRPDKTPPLLTTPERKMELLSETDLDVVVVLAFDRGLASWTPERFAVDVLARGLSARAVIVGEDWRFGHRAAGDVRLLEKLGGELGFEVDGMRLAELDGETVSSSRVRALIGMGDVAIARGLLGRHFDMDGVIIHGDDRGAALGFPTANFALDPKLVRPPRGVYACRARAGAKWYAAAVNIGVNPTFGGDPEVHPLRVEAYLIGFSGDLYGKTVRIEFHKRLRDERRFKDADALIEQMDRDVQMTKLIIDPGTLS